MLVISIYHILVAVDCSGDNGLFVAFLKHYIISQESAMHDWLAMAYSCYLTCIQIVLGIFSL